MVFDWTISLGSILTLFTILCSVIMGFVSFVRKFDKSQFDMTMKIAELAAKVDHLMAEHDRLQLEVGNLLGIFYGRKRTRQFPYEPPGE